MALSSINASKAVRKLCALLYWMQAFQICYDKQQVLFGATPDSSKLSAYTLEADGKSAKIWKFVSIKLISFKFTKLFCLKII